MAKKTCYVELDDGPRGPLTAPELVGLAQSGTVTPDTPVRIGEDGQWVKAGQIKGLCGHFRQAAKRANPGPDQTSAIERIAESGVDITNGPDAYDRAGEGRNFHCPVCGEWYRIPFSAEIPSVCKNCMSYLDHLLESHAASHPTQSGDAHRVGTQLGQSPDADLTFASEVPLAGKPAPTLSIAGRRFSRRSVMAVAAIAIALPIAIFLFARSGEGPPGRKTDVATQPDVADDANPELAAQLPGDMLEIVRQADRAVVEIQVPDARLGSGFLVSDNNVIATNYHVVEGTDSAMVRFRDGRQVDVAGFVAVLPEFDLVLLTLDAEVDAAPMPLADRNPERGETVLAFGSPKGLTGTVTDGIISAVRPGVEMAKMLTPEIYVQLLKYDLGATWIQTSAPISAGNSGGPLVNGKGEVVGVNTFIRKGGENLNFAISVSHLRQLLARQHEPLSFSLLPAPREWRMAQLERESQKDAKGGRDDLRRELAGIQEQLRKNAETRRKVDEQRLAEARRQRQASQDAASRNVESEQKQQALNRLNGRIIALRAEVAEKDQALTALGSERSRVVADAKATYLVAARIKKSIALYRQQAAEIGGALSRQQSMYQRELAQAGNRADLRARVQAVHEPIILQLQRKLAPIQSSIASFTKQGTELEARLVALDSDARSLKRQITSSLKQRAALVNELQGLVASYNDMLDDGK